METLIVVLAVIVVLVGAFGRRRVQDAESDESGEDETIDEDAIRAAEDEFWEKDWEEPEEWGR